MSSLRTPTTLTVTIGATATPQKISLTSLLTRGATIYTKGDNAANIQLGTTNAGPWLPPYGNPVVPGIGPGLVIPLGLPGATQDTVQDLSGWWVQGTTNDVFYVVYV